MQQLQRNRHSFTRAVRRTHSPRLWPSFHLSSRAAEPRMKIKDPLSSGRAGLCKDFYSGLCSVCGCGSALPRATAKPDWLGSTRWRNASSARPALPRLLKGAVRPKSAVTPGHNAAASVTAHDRIQGARGPRRRPPVRQDCDWVSALWPRAILLLVARPHG